MNTTDLGSRNGVHPSCFASNISLGGILPKVNFNWPYPNVRIIGSAICRSLCILLLCFIFYKGEIPRSKLRGISLIVICLVTVPGFPLASFGSEPFFLGSLICTQHLEHFAFGLIELPVSVGRVNIVINETILILDPGPA